ncbi:MAG: glutamine synthetase type III, partial [bacterium]
IELESRYEIMFENYIKALNIEAMLTEQIAETIILPVAIEYQGKVAGSLLATKTALPGAKLAPQEALLEKISGTTSALKTAIDALAAKHAAVPEDVAVLETATYYRDKVLPAMLAVREAADTLENLVDDAAWPLPKYREMLFIA